MHYQIHNAARDVHTRTRRSSRPTHAGLAYYIMNGTRRLIRGRPITVTEDQLKQHIEELRAKAKEGLLYVTLVNGQRVNLWTGKPGHSVPPPNPRPSPPLDSAARDKAAGLPMNVHPKEPPPPKDFKMPVPPPLAATENPVAKSEAPTLPPRPPPPVAEGEDSSLDLPPDELEFDTEGEAT